jgi:predicted flap endonuclease-1-like 5' DNA nuclease
MGWLLGFVIGVIVGVIGAWWFFERRDAQSREAMEAGWKKKLEHVEAEVRRADAAHDETKERLRRLQQESLPAPTPAPAAPAAPASGAASRPAAAPEPGEAERIAQARRRIDAKLAQLPAGSSARRRLVAERAALDAEAGAPPAPAAPQPLFTPPAEAPDDLELIRGIGPVLKARLNKLGITTFAQIAAFSEADLQRIDEVLDFKGRIVRERWVEQANALRDKA